MKIETKFNIGDTIWFFKTNLVTVEPINDKIINIVIVVFNDNEVQIRYGTSMQDINEKFCCATKDELLTQLH